MKARHISILCILAACGTGRLDVGGNDDSDSSEAMVNGVPGYLNDSEPAAPTWFNPLFPRVTNTGGYAAVDGMKVEELSKFHAVNGSVQNDVFERLHAQYPDILRLRYMSARAYQEPRSSMPLDQVFPGHFLMTARTQLSAATAVTPLAIVVDDIDAIDPKADLMIWDDMTFGNVEHATVKSVDRATRTVHLGQRGFQVGGTSAHPKGAFVASHMNGAVISPHFWAFNFSTLSPLDGKGHRFAQVYAEWVTSHLNDAYADDGGLVGTYDSYDGILWDISGDSISQQADCDLDGIAEGGVSADGSNTWGDGMRRLFVETRDGLTAHFPGRTMVQSGGTTNTRGYGQLNGDQLEGFPFMGPPQDPSPDYDSVDQVLGQYNMFMHHLTEAPVFTECRNKTPNLIKGDGGSNAPFRFALGLALMDDGVFSEEKSERDWNDEFSVRPDGGCVRQDEPDAEKRANRGWLGTPKGPFRRLITFDTTQNEIDNSGFEVDLSGWSANGATLTRVVGDSAAGVASMKMKPSAYAKHAEDITVSAGAIGGLQPGPYTVSFAVRGTQERRVDVTLGGKRTTTYVVPTTWVRRVAVLDVPPSGVAQLQFLIGGPEEGALLIDTVHVQRGDADLFRRDFEHGTIVVNGTTTAQTVGLPPGMYKRLRGTQDAINDGQNVDLVTIAPRDAAILITR